MLRAFNPAHAVELLVSPYNKLGFMILGSVFLAATGAEALYSDMGHVGRESIYISWPLVKICLILNYLGQGAWLLSSRGDAALASLESLNPFFLMLPGALRPVAVILSALAAVIASQALITGSYTLVSEAIRLDLMPHLKVQYPAETKGQIYIGAVNKILWVGCTFIVLLFRSSARMESAYGLAITVTMLMTTLLLFVYLSFPCAREESARVGRAHCLRRDRDGVFPLEPVEICARRLCGGHYGAAASVDYDHLAPRHATRAEIQRAPQA